MSRYATLPTPARALVADSLHNARAMYQRARQCPDRARFWKARARNQRDNARMLAEIANWGPDYWPEAWHHG
jgi:hypothetical protein